MDRFRTKAPSPSELLLRSFTMAAGSGQAIPRLYRNCSSTNEEAVAFLDGNHAGCFLRSMTSPIEGKSHRSHNYDPDPVASARLAVQDTPTLSLMMEHPMRAYIAEAVGTFVLVLGGCGTAVLAGTHVGFAGIALAFGLSLLAMVYAVGPVSGCHLNPAVTFGMVLSGKFSLRLAPGYVVAQLLGAIAASGVLMLIANGTGHYDPVASGFATNGYGTHSPDHYNLISALICETVLSAVLVLVILGSTDIKAPVGFAGIAIGLTLTLIHLISIPVTNTSVNPARSIGPALFVGGAALEQLWLFIVAPLLGAAVAAGVYSSIRAPDPATQIPSSEAQAALPGQQKIRIDLAKLRKR